MGYFFYQKRLIHDKNENSMEDDLLEGVDLAEDEHKALYRLLDDGEIDRST
ncbi:hypothetical protein Mpal_0919 [Methanosphaerula palustris E1-9c]|uniref:Uncharacterized protein n=1 Tax=Methanosphaerula palustris (strain ATCC BAA-1556 / DSM 19958 / E1-9c) TaxID=521011 RepID=B8GGL8_METPE|nr:hypothetical protein Mpal_0919 [Methanosphaerula palustris E1-9c]